MAFWIRAYRRRRLRRNQEHPAGGDVDHETSHFLEHSSIPTRLWDAIVDDAPVGIELAAVLVGTAIRSGAKEIAAFLARDLLRAAGMLRNLDGGDEALELATVERSIAWLDQLGVPMRKFATPVDRWLRHDSVPAPVVGARAVRHRGRRVAPEDWAAIAPSGLVCIELEGYYDHLVSRVNVAEVGELHLTDLECGVCYAARPSLLSLDIALVESIEWNEGDR